jgi:hypothetical protein
MTTAFVSRNEDQAGTSSYSLASQTSGTAGKRRWLFVWGRKNSAGDGFPATASIGGEALTPVLNSQVLGNITTDNTKFGARWFVGDVSAGGSQTIAFTFTEDGGGGAAATMIRAGYVLYESQDLDDAVHDTLVDEATATNDRLLTGSIDVVEGGSLLGAGVISVTASIGCTLTGIATEDVDVQESSANNMIVAGHEDGLSVEANRTVTFTWAAGGSADDACISVLSLAPEAGTSLSGDLTFPALAADGDAALELRTEAALSFPAATATGAGGQHPLTAALAFPALAATGDVDLALQTSSALAFPALAADGEVALQLVATAALSFPALQATGSTVSLSLQGTLAFPALRADGFGGQIQTSAVLSFGALQFEGTTRPAAVVEAIELLAVYTPRAVLLGRYAPTVKLLARLDDVTLEG